ncbi:DUF4365 domain-containing protein [Streptomyces somaliensis]|nr:DUF4365 domain-containing protein [Streptomyces somaliensis]
MMEQLQQGYLMSVAASAGCTMELINKDKWGVDAQFVRPPRTPHEEEGLLFAQLKCTTQTTPDPSKGYFSYQFTKRQYFDHMVKYRKNLKAILIVMTAPRRQRDWTAVDHAGLRTARACYWVHLEGMTADPGIARPSVRVPTDNLLDSDALTEIFDRLDRLDGGESLNG